MREIKFRAWTQEKKMVLVSRINWEQGIPESIGYGSYKTYTEFPILMQYTGLKDKNGKEIYEGDICKWQTYINDNDIEEQTIDKVKFERGAFTFNGFQIVESMPECIEGATFEVIGNIYENPKLLKE